MRLGDSMNEHRIRAVATEQRRTETHYTVPGAGAAITGRSSRMVSR